MRKKIFSLLLTALLVSALVTSTASAGGNVGFKKVQFSLGSLIADGFATGLGRTDVTAVLNASGNTDIICTNNGNNDVPGQSSPKVSSIGFDTLPGNDQLRKNGTSPFEVETNDPATVSWDVGGCPNSNWTAQVGFIFWTNAKLSVYDGLDPNNLGPLLASQDYQCATERFPAPKVSCTPVQ